MLKLFVILAALASGKSPAHAQRFEPLVGVASVIDGDTLEIHGQRIRLHGVDAPESRQICQDKSGQDYRCGQQAAFALSDHIGRSVVTCTPQDVDRYRRLIAKCSVRGEDIEQWLVSNGYAIAYRKYSSDYIGVEEQASAAHRGLWSGVFEAPWDWRHQRKGGF